MPALDCDWVVVGAGVIGLAVGRTLAQTGQSVLLLERHGQSGTETSARNSEVIHAGIYYPTGSLKAKGCVAGRRALYRYLEERSLPHARVGKVIVASGSRALTRLRQLETLGHANGVEALRWLDRDALRRLEPEVQADAALYSPMSGIIDSHQFMLSLQGDLEAAGGLLAFHTQALAVRAPDARGCWCTETSAGPVYSRGIVNAAGLGAVALQRTLPAFQDLGFYPCRGQYFSYPGRPPFRRLVYPLPESAGLGIHATPDLAGQIRFGPDVQWQRDLRCPVDAGAREAFAVAIRTYFPGLEEARLQPAYAGIRPKLKGADQGASDFRIEGPGQAGQSNAGLISLLGIESPGLTASLVLAAWVGERARQWRAQCD